MRSCRICLHYFSEKARLVYKQVREDHKLARYHHSIREELWSSVGVVTVKPAPDGRISIGTSDWSGWYRLKGTEFVLETYRNNHNNVTPPGSVMFGLSNRSLIRDMVAGEVSSCMTLTPEPQSALNSNQAALNKYHAEKVDRLYKRIKTSVREEREERGE